MVRLTPGLSRDSWGRARLGARGWRLGEQLSDLSVNVAKEVHVGSSAVQPFILHQELTEQHLWFVLLPHNMQLNMGKNTVSLSFSEKRQSMDHQNTKCDIIITYDVFKLLTKSPKTFSLLPYAKKAKTYIYQACALWCFSLKINMTITWFIVF